MTTAIEKELVKATKTKMTGNRQESLADLVRATNELADEKWRTLSNEAQEWYNVASEALDEESEIADFEEASDAEAEEGEGADHEAEESTESADETNAAETAPTRGKKRKEPDVKKPTKAAKANGHAKAPTKSAKAPAKTAAPKASAAKKPTKPAPAATTRSSRTEGGEGGPVIIRRAVIKNSKITAKELTEILLKKGRKVSPTTVSSVRAATVSVLKLLDEAGNLKNLKL